MGSFWQDVRYGVRVLLRNPGFTAVAVLTLALGIGANTALFSVVSGVLLHPLPFPAPDQLHSVYTRTEQFPKGSVSYPNFLDWQRGNGTFSALGAYRSDDFNLTGSGEAERLRACMVSSEFFPLLGVRPTVGRTFLPDEDRAGAGPVVVLADGLWKRKFGGAADVAGKTITLNGKALHHRGRRAGPPERFGRRGCVRPDRAVDRRDVPGPADQHGHARGRPSEAGSDPDAGPGGHGPDREGPREGVPRGRQGNGDHRGAPQEGRRRERRRDPAGAPRGRQLRAPHRLRQRRQPAARAGDRTQPGVRRARRPRRQRLANRAAASDRKRPARARRRARRSVAREVGHAARSWRLCRTRCPAPRRSASMAASCCSPWESPR